MCPCGTDGQYSRAVQSGHCAHTAPSTCAARHRPAGPPPAPRLTSAASLQSAPWPPSCAAAQRRGPCPHATSSTPPPPPACACAAPPVPPRWGQSPAGGREGDGQAGSACSVRRSTPSLSPAAAPQLRTRSMRHSRHLPSRQLGCQRGRGGPAAGVAPASAACSTWPAAKPASSSSTRSWMASTLRTTLGSPPLLSMATHFDCMACLKPTSPAAPSCFCTAKTGERGGAAGSGMRLCEGAGEARQGKGPARLVPSARVGWAGRSSASSAGSLQLGGAAPRLCSGLAPRAAPYLEVC